MSTALSNRVSGALRPFFSRDPFTGLQREMDELLSRFKSDFAGDWNGDLAAAVFAPSVDLSETDDKLQIRLDVPGLKANEIDIEVSGDTIRISGEHKEQKEEKGKSFHRLERRTGAFARALTLPCAVKENEVTAECADGVLTINLPKTAVAKTQKITVKAAGK